MIHLENFSFPIFYKNLYFSTQRSCCFWQHRHLAQKVSGKLAFYGTFMSFGTMNLQNGETQIRKRLILFSKLYILKVFKNLEAF